MSSKTERTFPRRGSTLEPSVLAWLRLSRVYHKVSRRSEDQMRCHGLSMAQFDVLAHVGAAPGITQQELADSLLVTKGNVCQLLDRMQRGELIERRQEGRANRLFLTDRGDALFRAVVPAHESMISDQLASLSEEQQLALLDLVRMLDHALDEPGCDV